MKPTNLAYAGMVLVIGGAIGLGLSATRYQTTNMDRGVTAVLDHWTGAMMYCRIGRGCEPMTKKVELTIEKRCAAGSTTIDARDPAAIDALEWRVKNCPPNIRREP